MKASKEILEEGYLSTSKERNPILQSYFKAYVANKDFLISTGGLYFASIFFFLPLTLDSLAED